MTKTRNIYWRKSLAGPKDVLSDVIKTIDASQLQIAMIVNNENRLLGTITDGDVRRAVLAGKDMSSIAETVMNSSPTTVNPNYTNQQILKLMNETGLRQIPIIKDENIVVGIAHIDDMTARNVNHENWVVIMAGGLGERLRPLTKTTPKPLLHVGGKPVIEIILESFIEQNFNKFYISINYRREMIKNFLGDGSRWGATIKYLEEEERLGTAGALSLIPNRPEAPFIVMNGDLVTRFNFLSLLDCHNQNKSTATMCVREYDIQVPYGVINISDGAIKSIDEKPVHRFFVNAGIYVLSPSVLELVHKNKHLDMNKLFDQIIETGLTTTAFPLREQWIDIGQMNDLERANKEYKA